MASALPHHQADPSAHGGGGGGGFIHPSLPSPAPSSALSASTITSSLPRQRTHPLVPGSSKENTVVNHVDSQILAINRRHAKKFSGSFVPVDQSENERDGSSKGYDSFREVVKDMEGIIDILWVSGTREFGSSFSLSFYISIYNVNLTRYDHYSFSTNSIFNIPSGSGEQLPSRFPILSQGYIPSDQETGYRVRLTITR